MPLADVFAGYKPVKWHSIARYCLVLPIRAENTDI
ncbi:hypothetical protein SNOG_10218 [Parastagonospora nodorum SN15]|uniref:Uncharacterized protein n=1 Tax=Phaeosphaeria nodorum (strain SN15 / ATCC MYA-4574 / FGSC 10173) TaxID=321614 RepID=Q0UDE6_PHANO|nr:hypothetical protein SNOG_10218 [Parastagonospora nodorum SN15]EAT82553.1 hypothetical protein SNOG_10218 [Parastagonospora nodorum SN15]